MAESVITITVKLEIATRKKGDVWLAWCPPVDVMSQADTKKEAVDSLTKSVDLWFESCIRRGVLEEALTEAGFKPINDGEPMPKDASAVAIQRQGHARRTPRARHRPSFINVTIPAYIAARRLQGASC